MAVQPLPVPVDRTMLAVDPVGDGLVDGLVDGPVGAQPDGGCCGACACGAEEEDPVLDLRAISWGVRESAALAVFGSVPTGGSMIVISPDDPVELLHQLGDEAHGELEVEYLADTPGAWRLRVTRGFRLFS
ncbi:DUF2249 domain-containing protein [Cellulomonas soli]